MTTSTHDQWQETNLMSLRHWTGTAFVSKKEKGTLKIDQSVKMPWHRLSMGVACFYSSAPAPVHGFLIVIFITIFFFFFQADCGCVQGYECKPAGYGSYWGKCVEESGSGMGAWYPSNRHVYDGTRNMKSLLTLGKLMQRSKTWIKQFCENRELIAIDILAFQSDMIYKRVAIFLLPLIYFDHLFVCLFLFYFFVFCTRQRRLFSFSYAIFFHANPRFHMISRFQHDWLAFLVQVTEALLHWN